MSSLRVEGRNGQAVVLWVGASEEAKTYQVQRRVHRPEAETRGDWGALSVSVDSGLEGAPEPSRFEVVAELEATGYDSYEFADDGVAPGQRYTYRVRALPVKGRGSARYQGPEVSFSWDTPPAAPKAPRIEPVREGIHLTWEPVPGASGYRVYQERDGTWRPVHMSLLTLPSLTDLGEHALRQLPYVVRAVRLRPTPPRELEGPSSPPAVLEPVEALAPAPQGVRVVEGKSGMKLSWRPAPSAPPGLRYHVARRVDGEERRLTKEPIQDTTFSDPKPVPGATYVVYAVDAAGRVGSASEVAR